MDVCHPSVAPCNSIPNTSCLLEASTNKYKCLCDAGYFYDNSYQRCISLPEKLGDPCHPLIVPCTQVPRTECMLHPDGNDVVCWCRDPFQFYPNLTCLELPSLPGHDCDQSILPCDLVANTSCQERPNSVGYYCECIAPLVNDPEGSRCLSVPEYPLDPCHPSAAPCNMVEGTECVKLGGDNEFR